MIVYFIFAWTFLIVFSFFYLYLHWRWQKRLQDIDKIFKSLDLPQIDMEDIHRVPFH